MLLWPVFDTIFRLETVSLIIDTQGNEAIASALLPQIATNAKVLELKIDEIIFDAAVTGQSDRNQWNYDNGSSHTYDAKTLDKHKNHIHFAVKAK